MAKRTLHTFVGLASLPPTTQAVICRSVLNSTDVSHVEIKTSFSPDAKKKLGPDTLQIIGWSATKTIAAVAEVKLGPEPLKRFLRLRERAATKTDPKVEAQALADRSLVANVMPSKR